MIFPSLNSAQPEALSSRLCFLLVAAPPRLLAPGSVAGGSYDVQASLSDWTARGGCRPSLVERERCRPVLSVLDSEGNRVVECWISEGKTRFFSV